MADGDLEEEEMWALVRERKEGSPSAGRRAEDHHSLSSASYTSKRLPSASKLIPRANANAEESRGRNQRQSALFNIPDWSEIYGSNTSTSHGDGDEFVVVDDSNQVPPHEWLAMKLARSQIASFSVCEGAGRTLKGRDQRKVRNAVLTRTGFIE